MRHGAAESTARPRVQKTHTEPSPHSDACYRPSPSSGARPSRRTRRRRDGVFFAHVSCRRAMGCANFQNLGRNGVQLGRLECHVAQILAIRMPHRVPAAPASNEQRKRGSNVGVMSALGALSLAALAPSPRRIGAAVRLVGADPPSHARLLAAVPPLTPLAARTALVRPHVGTSTRRPRTTTQSRIASLVQSCARIWV